MISLDAMLIRVGYQTDCHLRLDMKLCMHDYGISHVVLIEIKSLLTAQCLASQSFNYTKQ